MPKVTHQERGRAEAATHRLLWFQTHVVPSALSGCRYGCRHSWLKERMNGILSDSAFSKCAPWSTNATQCCGEEGVEAKTLGSSVYHHPFWRFPVHISIVRARRRSRKKTCFISQIGVCKKHLLDAPFCQSLWETSF